MQFRFRAMWPDAPITASRNLERLRNFFRRWQDAGWIDRNPTKAVRLPKVSPAPTLPFEQDEFEKILAARETHSGSGKHGSGNRARLRALILLMRHSGLRIRDAATLERSRMGSARGFPLTMVD